MSGDLEITRRVRRLIESADGPRRMDLSLARVLGISRSSAVDRLTGRARWKASEVREIAEHYGVAPSYILGTRLSGPGRAGCRPFTVDGVIAGGKLSDDGSGCGKVFFPSGLKVYEVADSFLAPLLMPGDVVFVSGDEEAADGDLVVVDTGEERSVGRLTVDGSNVSLSADPGGEGKPIYNLADVQVHKVVGVRFS